MIITTVSAKGQTTISRVLMRDMGFGPGTRVKQSRRGKDLIFQPVEDVMTAFGALAGKDPTYGIKEETGLMEAAVAKKVMAKARLD